LPQFEQVRASGVAHSSQNFAPERFSCWHRGHFIYPSRARVGGGRDGGTTLARGHYVVNNGVWPSEARRRLRLSLICAERWHQEPRFSPRARPESARVVLR